MTTEDIASDLNEFEKAVMIAMCEEVNNAKKAHIPIGTISRNFPSHLRGDVKGTVKKKLKKKGYVNMHSTGNNDTYELTEKGFKACQIITVDDFEK